MWPFSLTFAVERWGLNLALLAKNAPSVKLIVMKNILVPTDFSVFAGYALDAALQFARRFDAQLHLVHAAKSAGKPERTEDGGTPKIAAASSVADRLQQLMMPYSDVTCTTRVLNGPLPKALASYVDQHGIDLIIMGSHGASGKQEFFVGSNTQKVVRTVHCPVLILKEPLKSIQFDKVVFASGFYPKDRPAFLAFKNLVKHFVPEFHLVTIHTSSLFDPPYVLSREVLEDYQKLCAPFKSEVHIYRDFTVDQGIRSFSKELEADLIGISNHDRHPIKRMLVGSNVEALVNHSRVPVLSIDFQKEEHQNDY